MKIKDNIEQLTELANILEHMLMELKILKYPLNEYIVKEIYMSMFLKPKN
jgi:hypothetical protein